MKISAIRYPTKPQPGNVRTQAQTISLTVIQFTEDSRLAAPTPMMAVVFVCVVLTGKPQIDESKRQAAAPTSALKP
jgi:hypothetical protein